MKRCWLNYKILYQKEPFHQASYIQQWALDTGMVSSDSSTWDRVGRIPVTMMTQSVCGQRHTHLSHKFYQLPVSMTLTQKGPRSIRIYQQNHYSQLHLLTEISVVCGIHPDTLATIFYTWETLNKWLKKRLKISCSSQ